MGILLGKIFAVVIAGAYFYYIYSITSNPYAWKASYGGIPSLFWVITGICSIGIVTALVKTIRFKKQSPE